MVHFPTVGLGHIFGCLPFSPSFLLKILLELAPQEHGDETSRSIRAACNEIGENRGIALLVDSLRIHQDDEEARPMKFFQ